MKCFTQKLLTGIALAAAALAGPAAYAEKLGATYDEILAGARKENKMLVWMYIPSQPATHRAIIEGFNKKFGLTAQVEWVPMAGPTANTRAIAETAGRQVSVDVIGGGAFDEVNTIVKSGIVKGYEWNKVFGKEFPAISVLENRLPGDFKGKALPFTESHYGIVWNPNVIKDADVPSTYAELADPKWKGKFSFNAFFLTPLDIVSLGMGEQEALEFSRRLFANQPVLAKGSGASQQLVSSGQVGFGGTISNVAERAMRAGEPLKFKLMNDYIPISDVYMYVPENSPNPNMARLFTAWFSTEGYKIADQLESNPSAIDPNNKFRQMAEKNVATSKAKIVRITSIADSERVKRVREANALLVSGQK